jgi:hypothetical protein
VKRYKKLFPDVKINVLRSFAVRDDDVPMLCKKIRPNIGGLILDSGTWTKNQAPLAAIEDIKVEKYIAFLRDAAKYFDFYFNFDSNFEPKALMKTMPTSL